MGLVKKASIGCSNCVDMFVEKVSAKDIYLGEKTAEGVAVTVPGTDISVLQIRCRNGMLFCGLFDPEAIERFGFAAAVFSAPTFEDMLSRTPKYVSKAAEEMGADLSMTGRQIAELFS
ncbi:MAG: YunC family protein [bacterium]|nr:YunC family protein [bacterium]